MERPHDRLYVLLIYVVLGLATFVAFEPVRLNDFLDYDDNVYVTENPHIKAGLTRESVIWAFTTPHTGNWHPLTWLSHMLDCELFGLNPFWHHLTSLLFHIANTLLLFWVFKKMTGAIWLSAFVAGAFALHPLHVESVAWVAERKDVLSSFFWMLTIAAYIRYTRYGGVVRYLLVVLVFSLGLMAKPMLVTLPFVLLLLDYWPLGRFQWGRQIAADTLPQSKSTGSGGPRASVANLIVEKVPLFLLAVASSIATYLIQQSAGATTRLPLNFRIANALVSYVLYIVKMFYPVHLAVLYPHPADSLPTWQPMICFIILAMVSGVVIYIGRRCRYLTTGWLWYLGTLVPVVGLVQVGEQAMADRYTYLPSIGIFIMVAWSAAELVAKRGYLKIGIWVSGGILLLVMLICTRVQVRYWQNTLVLFEHTLNVTKDNCPIHDVYGNALLKEGQVEEAIWHIEEALRINPQYYKAQSNLGMAYLLKGKIKGAIACWNKLLRYEPDCVEALNNLAWIKATQEDPNFFNPNEAVQLALRACRLTKYTRADFLDTLGAAYAAAGNFPEAVKTAEKAVKLAASAGSKELIREIRGRLRLYKAGQAYREPSGNLSKKQLNIP